MQKFYSLLTLLFIVVTSPALGGTNEGRFEVDRIGETGAQPIILIPGLSSGGTVWDSLLPRLEKGFEVHVLTVAGFAGVPALDGAVLDPTVKAISNYIQENKLNKPIIIGHSIGGLMALRLALNDDVILGGLVVVDSLPFLAGLYTPGINLDGAKGQAQRSRAFMESLDQKSFLAKQRQGFGIMTKTRAHFQTLKTWAETSSKQTVTLAMYEAMATDFRADLDGIDIPVTVLAAWDPMMPVARGNLQAIYKAQYDALEGVEIKVIDNTFHFIMFDQPERFGEAVSTALETLSNIKSGD